MYRGPYNPETQQSNTDNAEGLSICVTMKKYHIDVRALLLCFDLCHMMDLGQCSLDLEFIKLTEINQETQQIIPPNQINSSVLSWLLASVYLC